MIPTQKAIKQTFFEVKRCPLYWRDPDSLIVPEKKRGKKKDIGPSLFGNNYVYTACETYEALVDWDHQRFIIPVSLDYILFTHEKTYHLGEKIVKDLFTSSDQEEVFCYVLRQSVTGDIVEYGMCTKVMWHQPELTGGWVPTVTMGNSYNKTKKLTCQIGFTERELGLNISFKHLSFTAGTAHSSPKSGGGLEEEIWIQIGKSRHKIFEYIQAFKEMIKELQTQRIARGDFLPMFCKFQGFTKQKLEKRPGSELSRLWRIIEETIERICKRFFYNGYSMLLVMADYVEKNENNILSGNRYVNLGNWVEDFLEARKKPNFSPHDYIGKEAHDAASWLETQFGN
ncbi:MAG: hypothetical protein LIP03_03595 [Bacteroidales bacterium]|nr:hypothetical protein [Bacteroidales bacterium]